ncbi:MAG: glycosyltransferase [Flavobacteriales bacterium]
MLNGKRILVAPLDWGLGHAARCVPLIERLLHFDAVPILGADKGPLAVLTAEFPSLEHVRIPGITVRYSESGNQLWSMTKQFPAMIRSVRAEHELFETLRDELKLDAVISDQRFGIRSRALPSVLITHQVFPFTPLAQSVLRKINLRNIARFDRCWIMDEPRSPGLAGELSHGSQLPENARYIGTQSRLTAMGSKPTESTGTNYRIVVVISGPEPQRSLLEDILLGQLQQIKGEHLVVRGLPEIHDKMEVNNVTLIGHMRGPELAQAMLDSEMIVSRSGYTTLMDLAALCRNALIIPTPGQAEQEYLGRIHTGTGRYIVQHQKSIDLNTALLQNAIKPPSPKHAADNLLDEAIRDLAGLLHSTELHRV